MSDDNDKNNVINVVFNPSVQTEADKITFSADTIDFSGIDKYLERELNNILRFDERERKQYVEDFLALGYDEFTAFKLANDLCKSSNKKNPR